MRASSSVSCATFPSTRLHLLVGKLSAVHMANILGYMPPISREFDVLPTVSIIDMSSLLPLNASLPRAVSHSGSSQLCDGAWGAYKS